jgi:two-component system, chemotaxis family, protein-glutamate methylesterase/glutaminase
MGYEAVAIGISAGGLTVLKKLLSALPGDFSLSVMIVQHISARSDASWIKALDRLTALDVKEAEEKDAIEKGCVYIAPANYHLLIENDKTISLTVGERVNYARPSIDVLFETAADAFRAKLIGIVMTGANNDGAKGLKTIKEHGGLTIVQDPRTAEVAYMPTAAISIAKPHYILSLEDIIEFLIKTDKQIKDL